jgi:hypothetical protein
MVLQVPKDGWNCHLWFQVRCCLHFHWTNHGPLVYCTDGESPLDGKAYMFGDNQSVITSGTIPHSFFIKCHNTWPYHCVREAIASDVIWFSHISGKINLADVLTKFLGHVTFWPLIKPSFFCMDSLHKSRPSLFSGMGNLLLRSS